MQPSLFALFKSEPIFKEFPMRGKWLAIKRTKNPLVLNITNSANAHDIADALLAFGTGESA